MGADGAQVDTRDSHNIMKYMNCADDGGDLEPRWFELYNDLFYTCICYDLFTF